MKQKKKKINFPIEIARTFLRFKETKKNKKSDENEKKRREQQEKKKEGE